jgi:hypothetical protein
VKRINPTALKSEWVAEQSLTNPLSTIIEDATIDYKAKAIISYTETDLTRKVRRLIDNAKSEYATFIQSGETTDGLLRGALCLAQLDAIYRRGFVDPDLGVTHSEDIQDLKNLISIVDPALFKAKKLCVLNATFGKASHLVQGADCDLLIDDMLIEVKTTAKLDFQTRFFHQIIGYITLIEIGGVDSVAEKPDVSKAGIYFSRHAWLFPFDLSQYKKQNDFKQFVTWFKDRANKSFLMPK